MSFALFFESIPPFVWVGLISMVVCFFVGYLSCPAVMESRKQGIHSIQLISEDAYNKHDYTIHSQDDRPGVYVYL